MPDHPGKGGLFKRSVRVDVDHVLAFAVIYGKIERTGFSLTGIEP